MLSVDLDNALYVDALRVYYNLKYIFPKAKVWIERTKKGYHVIADVDLSPEKNLKVREILGDDKYRLEIAEKRMRIHKRGDDVDICFVVKNRFRTFKVYPDGNS